MKEIQSLYRLDNIDTYYLETLLPSYALCSSTHPMMRVEVNIDEPIRGVIAKYARENNLTMPSAYAELLQKGLVVSDVDSSKLKFEVDESDLEVEE